MLSGVTPDRFEDVGATGVVVGTGVVILAIRRMVPHEREAKLVVGSVLALVVKKGNSIIVSEGIAKLCKFVANHMLELLLNLFDRLWCSSLCLGHLEVREVLSRDGRSHIKLTCSISFGGWGVHSQIVAKLVGIYSFPCFGLTVIEFNSVGVISICLKLDHCLVNSRWVVKTHISHFI